MEQCARGWQHALVFSFCTLVGATRNFRLLGRFEVRIVVVRVYSNLCVSCGFSFFFREEFENVGMTSGGPYREASEASARGP